MAHDVFISHSSKDKPYADAVCAKFEQAEIRCWIAPRDITPGSDWSEAIIDGIENCSLMVLVFSENANQSIQIKREVERAVNKGLSIVPVRIENVEPSKSLEYFISTPHWLDAMSPPFESHLDYLTETVSFLLKRTSEAPPPAPKPTPISTILAILKQPKVAIPVGLILLLLLYFGFRAPSPLDSVFVGNWRTVDQVNGVTIVQVNDSDGRYVNKSVIEDSGKIEFERGLIYLKTKFGYRQLISWEPKGPDTAKTTVIPNNFWGIVSSFAGFSAAQPISQAINNLALNAVFTRTSPASGPNVPKYGVAQVWELDADLAGQQWKLKFTISETLDYKFSAELVDQGTMKAKDGKWTTLSKTQTAKSGEYDVLDENTISLRTPFGPVVWKRFS